MQAPLIPRHSTRRTAGTTKRKLKRWLLRRAKQGALTLESASARCTELLPRSRWDRIVLFMFMCCLFTFLRALGGFGLVEDTPRLLNDTLVYPSTPSFISPTSRITFATSSNKDQVGGAKGVTRVVVGWHGEYELFPSTASGSNSPASIPQDAFPDPTPVLDGVVHGLAMDNPTSLTSGINPTMDFSAALRGIPYDPFHLDFDSFSDRGENNGLYPVAGPPSTARQGVRRRRFGRYVVGEDCM